MSTRPLGMTRTPGKTVTTVLVCALSCVLSVLAPRAARAWDRRVEPGGQLAERLDGLRLWIGGEVADFRFWQQREPSTGGVRSYQARVYAGPRAELEYELQVAKIWSLSFEASYFRSMLLSSWSARAGRPVETLAERLDGLAGVHVRFGKLQHRPWLGLVGGVGYWRYEFELPDDPELTRPTGNYTFARGRLQLRQDVDPVVLSAMAGYLHAWQMDDLGARKPKGGEAPKGYEALLEVRYYPIETLGISVLAGYTELRYRLKPLPDRDDKPARVFDRYVQLAVGAVVRF